MDVAIIVQGIREKSGQSPLSHGLDELEFLNEDVAGDVRDYFRFCLPQDVYVASGVRILPLPRILTEMDDGVSPGGYLRPFGYVVIGSDVGGNGLCVR
ncbi:MAG: hypothetical protein PHU85_20720, partial [Phycisphaerae bacterium]|nr:hypothetical protein [Phycisphaerae bacterium]